MQESPYFDILSPQQVRVPVIFNSPHSGRDYPLDFVTSSRLDSRTLRRSEDFMVDELFRGAVGMGAPLLRARFPRAWLDVNREPYELDPVMFEGALPHYVNARSSRVASGLGTIARIVAENEEIYRSPIPVEQAMTRIEMAYKPYHAALRNLLAASLVGFGHAVLLDCHSMPSTQGPGRGIAFANRRHQLLRADFVLGDRYGSACSPFLVHGAAGLLRDLGYRVAINKPYAGGFITEHYGRPANGIHALQIEVNRALYMDESRIEKSAGFADLATNLDRFVSGLLELILAEGEAEFAATAPLAAE